MSSDSTSMSDKPTRVRRMFSRIVRRYDLMNTLMTGGMDKGWRRVAVEMCEPNGTLALDIATGTAELALEMARHGARRVVGLDFCGPMLDEAARKTADLGPVAALTAGDAQALPFADSSFDRAINGFLLRNVADLPLTLREMHRVLRPGGRLVCLEITHPPSRVFGSLFRVFFYGFVPRLGGVVGGDPQAYSYLPDSLTHFPAAPELAKMLREAGFAEVRYRYLGFGAVAVHLAVKATAS
jgi:demethylmenaquinone methyltransferase / 2-methoxy-6-polyprenyl-1,4-benzoquinol methylase